MRFDEDAREFLFPRRQKPPQILDGAVSDRLLSRQNTPKPKIPQADQPRRNHAFARQSQFKIPFAA